MSEREQERGSAGCATAGIALIFLPMLYVLGIGPAVWVDDSTPTGSPFLRAMYLPFINLVNHSQPIEQAVNWYIALWR